MIVLWGDHGWKLGEHGAWCKHTNFEIDTRVPLICSAAGSEGTGRQVRALVEFVDIYPTLCELAGLPRAGAPGRHSFAPLLDEPDRAWKPAAFSQYPRGQRDGLLDADRPLSADALGPNRRQPGRLRIVRSLERSGGERQHRRPPGERSVGPAIDEAASGRLADGSSRRRCRLRRNRSRMHGLSLERAG